MRRRLELQDELVVEAARRVALKVIEAVACVDLGILGQLLADILVLGPLRVALGIRLLCYKEGKTWITVRPLAL